MARKPSALNLFKAREFRLLFTGRVVSLLGSAMAPIALAFAVLQLTGSVTALGLVLAARTIPEILFLLVGGVWADRLPRHYVMVVSDVVSGASQAVVALLLLTGSAQIWQLLILEAINGTASSFYFPASTGLVPQAVSASQFQEANALLGLAVNGTTIAGAALGGLLVAATNPGWTLLIDAVTYGIGTVFVLRLRLFPIDKSPSESFLVELRSGWREFVSRRWLWAIVLQFAFVNAAESGAFLVLGPVVARHSYGGAAAWGFILGAQAVGMVLGGLVALRFRPIRLLLVASLGVLLMSPQMAMLAIVASPYIVAGTALIGGLGVETFAIAWELALQQQIPSNKLSRVSSYDALGSIALMPAGMALAGVIAGVLGVAGTLWAASILTITVTAGVLAVPEVRTLRRVSI